MSVETVTETVIAVWEQLDLRPKPTGPGKWQALCPTHDDSNPSLSIATGDDGRVLLHCHAGCDLADVLAAVHLTAADLFPRSNGNGNRRAQLVEVYTYTDETGVALFEVCRFSDKSFPQRLPGAGKKWGIGDVRRVLYRLPKVIAAVAAREMVFLCEGEKDVHALEGTTGVTATCNPMGAGKWRPEYSKTLAGAEVTIVADRDKPGREHAAAVAESLRAENCEVTIVEAAEGKDAHDHLAAGKTIDEFVAVDEADTPEPEGGDCAEFGTISEPDPSPFRLTDLGNAERLVDEHGPDLLYTSASWYAWDGQRYERDEAGSLVVQRAKTTVRAMYAEAARLDDADERKALSNHATRSEAEPRLRASVSLAQSDPAVRVKPNDLDAQPLLLSVPNGTIELETGALREHRRKDRSTMLAGAPYEPAAQCPLWLKFLDRIFAGDQELIAFLRRAIGYMLTGATVEQVLFLLYGNGANGKSVLLTVLRALLGDYARNTPASTLLERRNGGDAIPNDLARLRGVRLVTAAETGDGRRLDEERVKALTGSDVISARFMRGEWFDFTPDFKLLLATNHLPVIRGTDHAMWRRVRLIPFTVTIPDDEQDRDLSAKLLAELPGILAWAVQGCLEWQDGGLQPPAAVMAATKDYREEMDTLGAFIADACDTSPNATEVAADLYRAYCVWCEINGERYPLTQTAFGRRLSERGFAAARVGSHRLRRGIALRGAATAPDDDDESVTP